MSSYTPNRGAERDYRGGNDERYYEDERIYYTGPDAAAAVPRGREAYDSIRGQQMMVRVDISTVRAKADIGSHISSPKVPTIRAVT